MISDFHLHTEFSGDSDTPVRKQVERAISLGMKEICITDHHDYDADFTDIDFTLDIEAYLTYMKQIQEEYKDQIRVGIGIELGLQTHLKDYLERLLEEYSFDFVIGSSHFADQMDPYFPEFFNGRTEREAYGRFFEVSLKRAKTLDCFDSYGHLDYVVRYGPNKNRDYSYRDYQEYIDPILKALIAKGKGLECNTGGYKYRLGHPNPAEDILKRYRELGGEILTIGSDAHAPEHVGYGFDLAREALIHCGFRYYTVFHERKPEFRLL